MSTSTAVAPLEYPVGESPVHGAWRPVRDGVYWLRQRLPFELDHINVYAVEYADGWFAVDTGINSRSSQATWLRFRDEAMAGRGPDKLICTHLHPDHVGLAGWFARELQAPLWMTRTEYLHCRILVADTGRPAPPEGSHFYALAGLSKPALERYRSEFGGFGRLVYPLPESYFRLRGGDRIEATTTGRTTEWEVVIGSGHSPEHACLLNRDLNVMMSGDQILPKISSNVSVWPTEPDANPLGDWLESCRTLKAYVNDETLVCPAHGEPFTGAPRRLDALIAGHERKLAIIREAMNAPMRAVDVAGAMFSHVPDARDSLLAVGETIAHLNYLVKQNEVKRFLRDGTYRYSRR